MNVELKLIVLHLNLQTKNSSCLLEEKQLISRPLLNGDIDRGLRDILLDYLEIEPDWVRFTLIDVLGQDDQISIVYGCMIPYIVKNINGTWNALGDIDDNDTRRLVFQASQTVKTF